METGMPQWDQGTSSSSRSTNQWSSSITEIEEERLSEEEEEWERRQEQVPMASIKEENCEGRSSASENHLSQEDCVYVGIGKGDSSMDALLWTLHHSVSTSATLYLLHVFPETRFIPSPLGKLPKNQVNKEQLESYMAEESGKRREFLQKFIDTCNEAKVKVDTILLESDGIGKAISDLIPILHIRKLVLGTSKSRKSKNKKTSGTIDQIMQNGHAFCNVTIVCEGKEVKWPMIGQTSPNLPPTASPLHNEDASDAPRDAQEQEDKHDNSFTCMCFNKPSFM